MRSSAACRPAQAVGKPVNCPGGLEESNFGRICGCRRIGSGMVASNNCGYGWSKLKDWGATLQIACHCSCTYRCSHGVRSASPRRWLSTSHRTAVAGPTWRWQYC
eukprot:EG_transcript_57263